MTQLATSLLLLVVSIFLLAHSYVAEYPWLVWVEAFAEAAAVGALADWFAVTALFRRPLGLPIPHTAIVSRNKDRIADTLGEFIEVNFLTPALVQERVRSVNAVSIGAAWLLQGDRLKHVAHELSRLVLQCARTLGEEALVGAVSTWIREVSRRGATLGKGLGVFFDALLKADEQGILFERAVVLLRDVLRSHSDFLRERVRGEVPWYIPGFVQDKIYRAVVERLEGYFSEVVTVRDHPARAQFKKYIATLAFEFTHSPQAQERLSHWFHAVLSDAVLGDYIKKIWNQILEACERDLERGDDSEVQALLVELSRVMITTIEKDSELSARTNGFVQDLIILAVERYRSHVGNFIAQTMKTWDSDTLVRQVEERIGNDLQFVRINGTLVGGLVGVVLYSVKILMG
jgi:uncharacterized membrane-anchored protein YjiN (DUF445 family)